jgi:hypothetical protein
MLKKIQIMNLLAVTVKAQMTTMTVKAQMKKVTVKAQMKKVTVKSQMKKVRVTVQMKKVRFKNETTRLFKGTLMLDSANLQLNLTRNNVLLLVKACVSKKKLNIKIQIN